MRRNVFRFHRNDTGALLPIAWFYLTMTRTIA